MTSPATAGLPPYGGLPELWLRGRGRLHRARGGRGRDLRGRIPQDGSRVRSEAMMMNDMMGGMMWGMGLVGLLGLALALLIVAALVKYLFFR